MLRGFDDERRLTGVQRPVRLPSTLKEAAQPLWHGEHPLAHRERRENVIDQVRGSFGHAPRVAGGAHTTVLAGVDVQEIVLALVAVAAVRRSFRISSASDGSHFLLASRKVWHCPLAGEYAQYSDAFHDLRFAGSHRSLKMPDEDESGIATR